MLFARELPHAHAELTNAALEQWLLLNSSLPFTHTENTTSYGVWSQEYGTLHTHACQGFCYVISKCGSYEY